MFFDKKVDVVLQELKHSFLTENNVKLRVLREDLIHPTISGNKWRKLKYNMLALKKAGFSQVLTFGGAYSNHILATAVAAKEMGVSSIGVVRGEEVDGLNPTLLQAKEHGMDFHFISRERYRDKYAEDFIDELKDSFGDFYLIPEGGTNKMAVKGCEEILSEVSIAYDTVCVSFGTGGTATGLLNSLAEDKEIHIYPALRYRSWMKEEMQPFIESQSLFLQVRWFSDYHFGGYAKVSHELVEFVKWFKSTFAIPLDLVYTGKLFYGLFDQIKNTDLYNGKEVLVIHTGGIQGNRGMEVRLGIQL